MKIDFYVLENIQKQQAMLFACRLLESAYADKQTVYVHTDSLQESERLDKLLWTYRDDSFLPHDIYNENTNTTSPILIGHNAPPKQMTGSLLNLHNNLPDFHKQFSNVIEIVFADSTVQQFARDRYRQYRDAGFTLNTHKLKAADL